MMFFQWAKFKSLYFMKHFVELRCILLLNYTGRISNISNKEKGPAHSAQSQAMSIFLSANKAKPMISSYLTATHQYSLSYLLTFCFFGFLSSSLSLVSLAIIAIAVIKQIARYIISAKVEPKSM